MMTNADTGPWPVRLERSPVRLSVLVAVRAAIGIAALVTAIPETGTIGTVLSFVGIVVLGYAALLGLGFVTMRLEALPGQLRLWSLLGSRRYELAKGEVRRLRLPPGRRSPVAAAFGGLGVRMGPGQLEGEKLAGVIALARPASLLMVPTTDGRLAVRVASEEELLHALIRATRRSSTDSPGSRVMTALPHGWELKGIVKGPREVDPRVASSEWVAWARPSRPDAEFAAHPPVEGRGDSPIRALNALSRNLRQLGD